MELEITNCTYYRTADVESYLQRLVQEVEADENGQSSPWRGVERLDVCYTSDDFARVILCVSSKTVRLKLPYRNKLAQSDIERFALGTADEPVVPQASVQDVPTALLSNLLSHRFGSRAGSQNRVINRLKYIRLIAERVGPFVLHIEDKADRVEISTAKKRKAQDDVRRLEVQADNAVQRIDYLKSTLQREEDHLIEVRIALDAAKSKLTNLESKE